MEENRKVMLWLALVGVVVLVLMVSYPKWSILIKQYGTKEISLSDEEMLQEEEAGQILENELQDSLVKTKTDENVLTDVQLVVAVEEENGEELLEISLWRSETGIGYFFLPGFAKGKALRLKEAADKGITLGNTYIRTGNSLVEILEGKAYNLACLDENGEEVRMPLYFLYSSDIPALKLTTKSGSIEKIEENKENEEAGRVQLFDSEGAVLYEGKAEGIKGRGNSTWGLSKKPFQFKLEEEADLFAFGAAKSWNLIANGYDETKLRNRIVQQLAVELGMEFVPQSQTLDLYVNDIYYGNYYLTEKVEVASERVDVYDREKEFSAAYGAAELDKIQSVQNEEENRKWSEVSKESEDLTGGYLFERELAERYKEEQSGFVTSQGDHYVLKSPQYASEEEVAYIGNLMQEFQDAVEQPDGIHPKTGKHYSEYIDTGSFVQKYLIEEISKNYDGGVTSSFFYKPKDAVSRKIYAGPVWDYDVAFGNCNLDEIASNPKGITELDNHVYGTELFASLYEKEDFYTAMTALYKEKALPYLEMLLMGGIKQLADEIKGSATLDSIRWEELENRYQYYQDYDNSIAYLEYFIEKRVEFLNEVWLEEEIYHDVTFVVEGEPWQIYCIKDGVIAGEEPVPSKYSALFMGWVTKTGVPYDRYKPVYEDMVFYATWQELPVTEVILSGP